VNVLATQTPRARARASSSRFRDQTLRQVVAGDNSGDMLKGENARVVAAHVTEQLKRAARARMTLSQAANRSAQSSEGGDRAVPAGRERQHADKQRWVERCRGA
jgi:hypothetical protein